MDSCRQMFVVNNSGSLKVFTLRDLHHYYLKYPVMDLGGTRDALPPVKISSFSCNFLENLSKSRLVSPLATPLGNLGSATDHILCQLTCFISSSNLYRK